jgi:hypothetical protein
MQLSSVTYPPEMLPRPEPGQEAEVFIQADDGALVKVWPVPVQERGYELWTKESE